MKARAVWGLLVALLFATVAVAPAGAQYPPSAGAGRVSRSVLAACQCTVFSGSGFQPGAPVIVTDAGTFVGNTRADETGAFSLRVCFDETTQAGTHTLLASGPDAVEGDREVRATVRVDGSVCFTEQDEVHDVIGRGGNRGGRGGARGPGKLPRTGLVLVVPALLSGFALVALGSMAVFVARRRRTVPL